MLLPVVAPRRNRDAGKDRERPGDGFDARLERVLEKRAVVPRELRPDVSRSRHEIAGRIVVDEDAPVRLDLTHSVPLPAFGAQPPRRVVKLAGHAGAPDEAKVVAEP